LVEAKNQRLKNRAGHAKDKITKGKISQEKKKPSH